jgi:hypothetical protein
LHGFNGAGNKRGLHLVDCIVDRHAGSFVQDLDAEDLAGSHGAVFVGTREGDIEGQDLVGIPRVANSFSPPTSRRSTMTELWSGMKLSTYLWQLYPAIA